VQDVVATELEADIARLEGSIRQLKIQFDMFFAGSIPKQPFELRREVEQLIRRHTTTPIRKYAPRFHFNALVGRFNSLSERWAKSLRALEEGDRPAPAVANRAGPVEQLVARCTVTDPAQERDVLKILHARLLDARKKAGESTGKLSFESFVRSVTAQAGKLREKTQCDKVELRIIVLDRKVLVKARPGR
jgi:hypothetical protein